MRTQRRARLALYRLLRIVDRAWCRFLHAFVRDIIIPCWACAGRMRQYGSDTEYLFYECPVCGAKKAERIKEKTR